MAEPKVESIFDMEPDAAHEVRLDAEADADYAAGRFVPHDRVREWLKKLARGERVPPPEACARCLDQYRSAGRVARV
jgi:predicted transcriptional regulator